MSTTPARAPEAPPAPAVLTPEQDESIDVLRRAFGINEDVPDAVAFGAMLASHAALLEKLASDKAYATEYIRETDAAHDALRAGLERLEHERAEREHMLGKVIAAKDAYIRMLRLRVYGRSDGSRPNDDELNAVSSAATLAESDAARALAAHARQRAAAPPAEPQAEGTTWMPEVPPVQGITDLAWDELGFDDKRQIREQYPRWTLPMCYRARWSRWMGLLVPAPAPSREPGEKTGEAQG
jgi:hypothetical protein